MEISFKRENFLKVSFITKRMEKIEKIYNNGKVDTAYLEVISLIKIICSLILRLYFHDNINDTAIITMANKLNRYNEVDIYNYLLGLISKEERIVKIDDYELNYILISLDEIIKITLEKYPEIFNCSVFKTFA